MTEPSSKVARLTEPEPRTSSAPRPTKAPSMRASEPSTAQASRAASGPRAASHSRALPAPSGRFRGGQLRPSRNPRTRRPRSRPPSRPKAAARRTRRTGWRRPRPTATTAATSRCGAYRALRLPTRRRRLQSPRPRLLLCGLHLTGEILLRFDSLHMQRVRRQNCSKHCSS